MGMKAYSRMPMLKCRLRAGVGEVGLDQPEHIEGNGRRSSGGRRWPASRLLRFRSAESSSEKGNSQWKMKSSVADDAPVAANTVQVPRESPRAGSPTR